VCGGAGARAWGAAGAAPEAAKRVGELICSHIIARPHGELVRTLGL
jgi:microcompartment protein CcmL/EutN